MPCKRCGNCCIGAFMSVGVLTDENREWMMEQGRWLAYHRCDVFLTKNKEGKEVMQIKIPIVCQQLVYKPNEGYVCKIYEKRPLLCRQYMCDNFSSSEREEILKRKAVE